jgi:hypothetical protein
MPTIDVPSDLLRRLQDLGGKLFTPAEVIERLLAQLPPDDSSAAAKRPTSPPPGPGSRMRVPRSRGVELTLNGDRISAVTVPDMYKQVLAWLIAKKHMEHLEPSIPYRTSNQRYLIAKKPKHPNGNEFVSPVGHGGYFMEAHKNYENALHGLQQFLGPRGIKVEYT